MVALICKAQQTALSKSWCFPSGAEYRLNAWAWVLMMMLSDAGILTEGKSEDSRKQSE